MDFIICSVVNKLKEKGKQAGKIQLQKIIYFLQYMDVKIPYSYVISRYGPFSGELSDKMEQMEYKELIEKRDQSGKDYVLKVNETDLRNYEREDYDKISDKIVEIIGFLPSLEFNQLELYATVHYCYDSLKLFYEDVNNDTLVKEVKKYKDNKFSKGEIINALDKLKSHETV